MMIPYRAVINYLSIFVFGLLSVPTLAILVTWNTLPGERLYPLKRNLENLALKVVGNNYKAQTTLRSQFVNRRFSEATTLLTQSASTEGLVGLTTDVKAAKTVVLSAKKPQERREAAKKLAAQLQTYNQQLEKQKQVIIYNQTIVYNINQPPPETSAGAPPSPTPPTGGPTVTPAETPLPTESLPPPASVPPSDVADEIEDTQEELEDIIDELEGTAVAPREMAAPTPTPTPTPEESPTPLIQSIDQSPSPSTDDQSPPGQDGQPPHPQTGNGNEN